MNKKYIFLLSCCICTQTYTMNQQKLRKVVSANVLNNMQDTVMSDVNEISVDTQSLECLSAKANKNRSELLILQNQTQELASIISINLPQGNVAEQIIVLLGNLVDKIDTLETKNKNYKN